ncbi:MAG: nucleoside-diphosphate kinase [Alteromonadaceae bacterium]|nr:MAG: nucleoside-diphosphate kinase [Alteromonadaceae bacterium]
MTIERTLSIVKPDAVAKNVIGEIYASIEAAGLKIIAAQMVQLDEEKAKKFYAEHKDRPFFNALMEFMLSGPIMVQVLEGENAIAVYRELMGSTNFEEAAEGTIRKRFASTITLNAVHGSDSIASAEREISYFFESSQLCAR